MLDAYAGTKLPPNF